MPSRNRALVVGALGAVVTIGVVLFAYKSLGQVRQFMSGDDSATVKCQGSTVELDFDPEGRIEARARGETVASAHAGSRELRDDGCAKAPTQTGWFVGIRYKRTKERTTLTCRFPKRFFVHVHSVSASWAGERPAGSAVYLVLGNRARPGPGPQRTIVASASVVERSEESDLMFAPMYCAASTNR